MQINLAFFVSFLVLALRGTIIRETNRRSTALHGFLESLHNSYTTGISCRAMDERRICGVSYPPSLADRKHRTEEDAALTYRAGNEEGEGGRDAVSLSDAEEERGKDVASLSDAEDEECQR